MISRILKSSIGRKQLVAVSGLALVGFLLAHLSGNFLIFKGPEALNDYSDFLHSLGGLLWVARIGLLGAFFLHFGLVIQLIIENRRARGGQYATAIGASTRNFATKTMRYSGMLIFIYIFSVLLAVLFLLCSSCCALLAVLTQYMCILLLLLRGSAGWFCIASKWLRIHRGFFLLRRLG